MYNKLKIFITALLLLPLGMQLWAQSAVTGFTSGASAGQITLMWNSFGSGWTYEIYWSTSPNVPISGTPITVAASGTNYVGYVHQGLTPGTTYYYIVRAASGGNYSSPSPEISNSPISQASVATGGSQGDGHAMGSGCLLDLDGNDISTTIANFHAAAGIESVTLWWDYLMTATSFKVEFDDGSGWQTAGTTSTLSYIHTGINGGANYSYRVLPTISGGCTAGYSTTLTVKTAVQTAIEKGSAGDGHAMGSGCLIELDGDPVAPGPTGTHVYASINSNVLIWDYYTGASYYTVEFDNGGGGGWQTAGTSSTLSYIHQNLTGGATYQYRVLPEISGGCPSGYSPTLTILTAVQAPTEKGSNGDGHAMGSGCLILLNGNSVAPGPTGTHVYASINSNVLIWDYYTGATYYTVEYDDGGGGGWQTAGTSSTLSYIHQNLTGGATYLYRVLPEISGGCPAGYSPTVSAITAVQASTEKGSAGDGHAMGTGCLILLNGLSVAPGPTGTHVYASINSNVLIWDYYTGANYYTVEYDDGGGGGWQTAGTTSTLSYIHSNLTGGATYLYRVLPEIVGGCPAGYSGTLSVITAVQAATEKGSAGDGHAMSTGCLLNLDGYDVPLYVSNLNVRASVEQATIWWDYLMTASSYTVEYNTGGSWMQAGTTTSLSYIHTGINPGVTYFYRVTPTISGGCSSAPSGAVQVIPAVQAEVRPGSNGDGHAMAFSCAIPIPLNGIDPVITPPGPISSCGPVNILLTESPTAQNYQWYLNGSPISGATGTTHTAISTGSYTVQIHTTDHNCWAESFPVVITGTPTQPGTIGGISAVCAGTGGYTYGIAPIMGATSYVWAYSGTGVTLTPNQNSVTVDFSPNATSGNLTVYGVNSCGNGPVSSTFPITVNQAAGAAGAITGPSGMCPGGGGITYSVSPIPGAAYYVWSYSGTGATISGMGNVVTITFAPNATSGNLSVYGGASCGNGSSSSLYITISGNFTITATAGLNGSITPSGAVNVGCGANQTFNMSANTGYHIADVVVDGSSVGAVSTYTFNNVQAAHTINVTFALNAFTITASAGANGSISPSGAVLVQPGAQQVFNFTPDPCYQVAGVIVDGFSQGAVSSYTFNNVTANHTISVSFSPAPAVIVCPSNVSVNTDAGACQATGVNIGSPNITGNCAGTTVVSNHPSTTYPKGTTTVTWTVTTPAGSTNTCQHTVTVTDNELPAITCPTNVTENATPGSCAATITYATPVGTDNCPGASTALINGFGSGSVFPVGTTTNTFRVTDAGGLTNTCSFTVTIVDNQNPYFSFCPGNYTEFVTSGTCGKVVNYTVPVGLDNCAGASSVQTSGLGSGATYPVGVTTNTFVVTDAAGLTNVCNFTVTVTDNQLPVISCPANITVSVNQGNCDAAATYTAPAGSDNCSGAITAQTAGLPSGSLFPFGTTTNTFKVTDASGNTQQCSFNVVAELQVRTLNLKVFMEGFYQGGGMMSEAMDYDQNSNYVTKWGAGIADTISVELHDGNAYSNIVYTAKNVTLHTDGSAVVLMPPAHTGNYYVTVRHRGHVETTTAAPVNFSGCVMSYDFSTGASKAYEDNMKTMGGVAVIYAGELTGGGIGYPGTPVQDGVINFEDINYIFNSYLNGDFGYMYHSDINSDGTVDLVDIYMSFTNYLYDVYAKLP